jgi:hypothetical protein
MVRVQVLVTPEEREAFRRMAETEGLSLSAWLRGAGLDRLAAREHLGRFRTVAELDAFFLACDRHAPGLEPDWKEHVEVMRRSRAEGESGT